MNTLASNPTPLPNQILVRILKALVIADLLATVGALAASGQGRACFDWQGVSFFEKDGAVVFKGTDARSWSRWRAEVES